MNRRQFFKTVATTVAGVVAVGVAPRVVAAKRPGVDKVPFKPNPVQKFWMQTYGPMYYPTDVDWEKADSTLTGIYSGETIINLNASDYSIGVVLVLNGGKRYRCTALHEEYYIEGHGLCSVGYYIKNGGVYIK